MFPVLQPRSLCHPTSGLRTLTSTSSFLFPLFRFNAFPKIFVNDILNRVHSEMVDFGSEQGRSYFVTAGVAALRRGLQNSENAGLDRKMPFLDGH
jgi:hypothetical protein